jgi:Rrf2 family protein
MFSKACEYGIKACIFLAINSYDGKRISPRDISKEIASPQAFTAKILQALVKSDIVRSYKGAYGGFEIDKSKLAKIKLAHIVASIDGDQVFSGCGLGLEICNENHPCPVHEKFKKVREDLKFMLENTSLEELALGIKSGEAFLKT